MNQNLTFPGTLTIMITMTYLTMMVIWAISMLPPHLLAVIMITLKITNPPSTSKLMTNCLKYLDLMGKKHL